MRKTISKFFCLLTFSCFCFLACPAKGFAESKSSANDLSVEVTYGFDNYSQTSTGLPVFVQITNRGSAIAGEVRLVCRDDTQKSQISYATAFSLASDSTETVVINTGSLISYTEVRIEILDENGSLIWSRSELSLNRILDDTLFWGYIGDDISKIDYLKTAGYYNRAQNIGLSGGLYFDISKSPALSSMGSLDQLDIICLDSGADQRLSEQNLEVLREWIYDGGALLTGPARNYSKLWHFLGIEPNYMNAQATEKKTDFGVSASEFYTLDEPVSLDPLPESPDEVLYQETRSRYQSQRLIMHRENEQPSPVTLNFYEGSAEPDNNFKVYDYRQEMDYGRGCVISLDFDFTDPSFASWAGAPSAVTELLGRRLQFIFDKFYDLYPSIYEAQNILTNRVAFGSFGIGKYVFILVVYILLVGPVSYLILKKIDRRHILWVSVPVLSCAFFAVIYLISSDVRKDGPFINEAKILQYSGGEVHENTDICVTLPAKGQYTLNIPDLYRMRYYPMQPSVIQNQYFSFMEERYDYDTVYAPGNHDTAISLNNTSAFTEWYFNAARTYYDNDNFDVEIHCDGSNYSVDVANHTEYDLDYSGVFIGDRFFSTGPIAAGESIHREGLNYDFPVSREEDYYVSDSLNAFFEVAGSADEDPVSVEASALVSYHNRQLRTSPVYFWGICSHFDSNALRESDWEKYGILLVEKSAEIEYADKNGTVTVPDINALLYSCEKGGYRVEYSNLYYGDQTCTYRLPEHFSLTEISESVASDIKIEVYNYAEDRYDAIDALKTDGDQALNGYVSDGFMRLRMSLDDNGEYMVLPVISVKGGIASD